MKRLLVSLFSLMIALPAHADAIKDYYAGKSAAKAGKRREAYDCYARSAASASAENLPRYCFHSGYSAAYAAHKLGLQGECRKHAELALKAAAGHPKASWASSARSKSNQIELMGLVERSFGVEGKLGAGWQANHRVRSMLQELCGHAVDLTKPDPAGMVNLDRVPRALAWRMIEREAEYLHFVGRTTEAVALLEAVLEPARRDSRSGDRFLQTYAIKIIGSLGRIKSFTGYKAEALVYGNEEASCFEDGGPRLRSHFRNARMNLLAIRSEVHGVTDRELAEAKSILRESKKSGDLSAGGFERLMARITVSRESDEERLERIRRAIAANEDVGSVIESFYARRNELFERSRLNEPGLDPEFYRFLDEARKKGNKKAEPRLYRRYGDWLSSQGRRGEAITVYQTGLRMTEQFQWYPQVPQYYAKLGAVFMADGQMAVAGSMWERMNQYIAAHPDIPGDAILRAWSIQLSSLLRHGMNAESGELADRARALTGRGTIASRLLSPFSAEMMKLAIAGHERRKPDSGRGDIGLGKRQVLLQPLSVASVALPGSSAMAGFYLVNSGSKRRTGTLSVEGPGLSLADAAGDGAPAFTCDFGRPSARVEVSLELASGTLLELPLSAPSCTVQDAPTRVALEWSDGRSQKSSALWMVSWGTGSTHAVVLDAARLESNPYVGTPVMHHVAFPVSGRGPVPFRLRSPRALHIEYRNPVNGVLIAVDRNGNGDFTEAGDFFTPALETAGEQVFTPLLHEIADKGVGSVEVWLYPEVRGGSVDDLELAVEIHIDGEWRDYARDLLQAAE